MIIWTPSTDSDDLAPAKASKKLDAARKLVIARLMDIWHECVSESYHPSDVQWNIWLKAFSADEVENAVRLSAGRIDVYSGSTCERAIRYASGILYRVRERAEEQVQ